MRSASAVASRKSWVTTIVGSAQLGEQVLRARRGRRARVRVERRQRLVEQQHAGVARERAGQRDALALAARERAPGARRRGGAMPQPLEQLVDVARPRAPNATFWRTVMCGNSA